MNDFNLLICDVEWLIREQLTQCAQKMGGFKIQTASSGSEALQAVKAGPIDGVILDIRMPGMDGLTFLKEIGSLRSAPAVIVLSGHDEFDYVQQCLHYGAMEYLLKPVSSVQMRKYLEDMRQRIEYRRTYAKKLEHYENEKEELRPLLRDQLFQDLLEKAADLETIGQIEDFLGMHIRYPYMITAVIRIDLARTHSALDREPLHLYTLTQIIEQRLSVRENLNIFRMASDTLIIFYGSTSRSVRTDLTALLEDLSDTLSANLPAPLLIGIGSVVEYVEDLRDSYTKALYALSVNQHQNRLPVLSYYDLSPTENDGTEYWEVRNVLSRIAANFASTDKHEILALLTTALERLQEMRDTDLNAAIHYCCSMISLALECLPANDTLREDNPYLTISRMKDLGSLYETVFRILSEVDGAIRTTQESQTERLAEACRKEINTHFDTKLTIEKLAEKLGVSRNYLSTIFRAKTGYSINEYLNLTRLEEAKRLLRESSILIYEVAERSGFSDQYYFSKVFKAHVGVTPNEYRYNYQH